jgi:hypothetical protein
MGLNLSWIQNGSNFVVTRVSPVPAKALETLTDVLIDEEVIPKWAPSDRKRRTAWERIKSPEV